MGGKEGSGKEGTDDEYMDGLDNTSGYPLIGAELAQVLPFFIFRIC